MRAGRRLKLVTESYWELVELGIIMSNNAMNNKTTYCDNTVASYYKYSHQLEQEMHILELKFKGLLIGG